MGMILSRTEVQTVRCPKCASAPGSPCTGFQDRVRDSNHLWRVEEYARVNQLPVWQLEWPKVEHALSREDYRSLVRGVPCPNCGADRDERCRSRRPEGRLSVHRERSESWRSGAV